LFSRLELFLSTASTFHGERHQQASVSDHRRRRW